ncbi:hypothetical protein ABZ628_27780 [Streptomyces diastaticus]|uniref:hypothetical protein n=1 Tax=Streptomyces diastaticus TaxID=1956 RepID=UPI0033DEB61A
MPGTPVGTALQRVLELLLPSPPRRVRQRDRQAPTLTDRYRPAVASCEAPE